MFDRWLMTLARSLVLASMLVPVAHHASAHAESWPARSVKFVVPFPAGGATDAIARLFAAKLQEQTGTGMIVENRVGAAGNIGADAVAKSAPDGYTVLFNINGMAVAPALYRHLAYDADNDFIRVTQLAATVSVLVVNPEVPARTFQELVALAKAKPGVMNYGSTGVGNTAHLGMELMKRQTGTSIQMVVFTGDAPLFTALIRNDVQMGLVPVSVAKEQIAVGAVRPVGAATLKRLSALPDIPTLDEQGRAGYDSSGWMGLFVPKGTAREIVDRLYQETRKALDTPSFAKRLEGFLVEPVGSTPGEFDAVWHADRERFARIVRDAGIPQQ